MKQINDKHLGSLSIDDGIARGSLRWQGHEITVRVWLDEPARWNGLETVDLLGRPAAALFERATAAARSKDHDASILYIEHHLEEFEKDTLDQLLGADAPHTEDALRGLMRPQTLNIHGATPDGEGESDVSVDVTLPDFTTYVLDVAFDDSGDIEDVTMES